LERYDFVLTNGRVMDGTGNPWFYADIGVAAGKVVKVGRVDSSKAARIIDVKGKIVCPGWIDVHAHSDFSILAYPMAQSKVMQGVTTEVNGCCGISAAPLKGAAIDWAKQEAEPYGVRVNWSSWREYVSRLEENGTSINVVNFIGHGTVRLCVVGWQEKVGPVELNDMKELVEDCMKQGAFGLSTGLVYPPGFNSTTEELIELCRVVREYGGIYTSHVRGDRETQIASVEEVIEIGRRARIPVHISHMQAKYPRHDPAWQRLKLSIMEIAREEGVDITADTHENDPITYGLKPLVPYPWRTWTDDKLREALKNPENRQKLKADMQMDPLRPEARGRPIWA
jgi:N-acyl-D-amino-acid deacylase